MALTLDTGKLIQEAVIENSAKTLNLKQQLEENWRPCAFAELMLDIFSINALNIKKRCVKLALTNGVWDTVAAHLRGMRPTPSTHKDILTPNGNLKL